MTRRVWTGLLVLLALRLGLGLLYAARVAPFNAPDEPYHLAYVDFVASRGRLPVADAGRFREGIQPPLYYVLAAPLDLLARRLPLASRLRVLRAQSVAYAVVNVLLIFLLARRAAGEEAARLAAAWAALLPQYLFIGASVTNDGLADLLGTAMLYAGLRAIEDPASLLWPAAAGLALGLGMLSKLTVACAAAALFAGLAASLRPGRAARSPRGPAVVAGVGLAVGIWPLLRNLSLYGDVFGQGAITAYDSPMAWNELPRWCAALFQSFWGLFAWMAAPLPGPVYLALALFTAACAAGFASWARPRRSRWLEPRAVLLWSAPLFAAAQAFYHGFLHFRQPQGRFLFPALGPIALFFALGLAELWSRAPRRLRPALAGLGAILTGAVSILSIRAL